MREPDRLSMGEPAARRIVLMRAIEQSDAQGKLLSAAEREQIDHDVRKAAIAPTATGHRPPRLTASQFLDARAHRVLDAMQERSADLSDLKEPQPWARWLVVGVPLAGIVFGIATDIIANPHRVDLIALPLLGILAWNLAMYAILAAGWVMSRGESKPSPFMSQLGRWTDGPWVTRRRQAALGMQVRASFLRQWYAVTSELHLQRIKRVLHLGAAGWAIGVILSLLVRGLVVEYRVGWESTFLDANQVHVLLNALRLPALLLFPFQPFTPQDVAALHFSQGGGAAGGARWVLMYVALLLVVVVIPRGLLAGWALLREKAGARDLRLDVADPYFIRIVSLQDAARVQVGVIARHGGDLMALQRVLTPDGGSGQIVASSDHGDVLRWMDLSQLEPAPEADTRAHSAGSWRSLWTRVANAKPESHVDDLRNEVDLVLHLVRSREDVDAARALIEWLGKPVILAGRDVPRAMAFEAFARDWTTEHVLFDAIGGLLHVTKRPGFDRIVQARRQHDRARSEQCMDAIAEHLLFAARQCAHIKGDAVTLRNLLPSARESQAKARQAAMDAIVANLQVSSAKLLARLRMLHGIADDEAAALEHELQSDFRVRQSVDAPQAAMAGAATGAAMGASVDLLAGGMTLGAAAALGALIGGGAAYVAAWRSRPTASGETLVQLSDDMMQALTEGAMLRYVAACQFGRQPGTEQPDIRPHWRSEVVAQAESDRVLLASFWAASRSQPDAASLKSGLATQLAALASRVLGNF
ncbi:MAG: DUF3482 domain-containing protein [Ramlibacter sp.]|nr:DUF3482 domain-containing protein [Ramlibacter sp.]